LTPWEAVILGIVQGATEFLPVSSSGHLVMAQAILGVDAQGVFFEVALHVATLFSVLLVYRRRVASLALGAFRRERAAWRYLGLLLLASVPAGIVGVFFEDQVEALFDSPWVVGTALLVTGALLWSTRAAYRRHPEPGEVGLGGALVMGVGQAFAITPGISRSGTTVVSGLWAGVEASEAAAFSFLMSVPAIAGAAVLQVPELLAGTPAVGWTAIGVGGAAAAVTGVLAIKAFVLMLKNRTFHGFALYCWAAGGLFLLWLGLA
jgi:undecaprenyl-diphosphatase